MTELNKLEETVLSIIRDQQTKLGRPITTYDIYDQARRQEIEDWRVRGALMGLMEKSAVKRTLNMTWIPTSGTPELKQVNFSKSRTIDCIKKLGQPSTPNEILQKFMELYGMPENVEGFLRDVRRLAEDSRIPVTRDAGNRYWIKRRAFDTRETTVGEFYE